MTKHLNPKLFLFGLVITGISFGCKTSTPPERVDVQEETPPKTIRNPKCEPVEQIRVFEVREECALARATWGSSGPYSYSPGSHGLNVCLPRESGKLYYDDLIIQIPTGKCVIYVGTYRYRRHRDIATVPIVDIVDSQIANPEQ